MAANEGELFNTLEAMRVYGGGFVKRIAEAHAAADERNAARLRDAFADYFAEYREIGQKMQDRRG
jgi:hypothetical protein